MQQELEREGERSERMEAAGNMITKEFDGGGAPTRVMESQQSGNPHMDTQEELEKEAERMKTKITPAS